MKLTAREINSIIAEASKGSKWVVPPLIRLTPARFYINQVRKDKELTEKIEWFKSKVGTVVGTGTDSSGTSSSACLPWGACSSTRTVL